jgi:hypothetical protein
MRKALDARRRVFATSLLVMAAMANGATAAALETSETPVLMVAVTGPRKPPPGLRKRTFELALRALRKAVANGQAAARTLTIIDYSLPSTARRLWVLDVPSGQVLFNELVAHGRRSGENLARAFSNTPGSHQSSLGAFVTGSTYIGRHGVSLRLHGLEPGINDRAEERAIVMHAADYVSDDIVRRQGRLGRSQGCPAVRPAIARSLIESIRDGTLVFAYYPDAEYEERSAFIAPG